ncbi:MAG: Rrf2 family transcriptional regulator [Gemmataceae bacterium]|nr:Rrf2 family transcriptional regulator [Gemmataceae bacterium]
MFSQTVEYALRAVVQLASNAPTAQTTEQIAKATKVLQGLVQAGIVKSQRGIGGGISLVKKPSELTILEVVNAVDPIHRIKTCPLDLASHGVRLCPLHHRVDKAMAMVEHAFASTTLQEVIDEPSESFPLCEFPPKKALQTLGGPRA